MSDIVNYIPEEMSIKVCKSIRDNRNIRDVISLMGRETYKNKKEYATKFCESPSGNIGLTDVIMGKKGSIDITDIKCKEGDKEIGFVHTHPPSGRKHLLSARDISIAGYNKHGVTCFSFYDEIRNNTLTRCFSIPENMQKVFHGILDKYEKSKKIEDRFKIQMKLEVIEDFVMENFGEFENRNLKCQYPIKDNGDIDRGYIVIERFKKNI
jgi:hypothetical protein